MPDPSSASNVPVEIVTMVMDWATITELLVLSRVCVRWRAVAHAHPRYWRDIRLESESTSALEFFQARLDYNAPLDVNLKIQLSDVSLSGRLQTILFPALSLNLYRVAHLSLDVYSDVAPRAVLALNGPAPRLRAFSLRIFMAPEEPITPLSPNIFAESRRLLRTVTFLNVQLPAQPVLAFEHVENLTLSFRGAFTFSTHFFAHFPALKTFRLYGIFCTVAIRDADPAAPPSPGLLRVLEVHVRDQRHHDRLLAAMPNLRAVESIVCGLPTPTSCGRLLSHLEGPIRLDLLKHANRFVDITLCASSGRRARTFVESEPSARAGWPADVQLPTRFRERITVLRLRVSLAFLACLLGELPCCETLEIFLDATGRLTPDKRPNLPLRLPALNTAVVRAHEDGAARELVTFRADELGQFLVLLIGTWEETLRLELHGVSLSGDVQALFPAFRRPQ